MNEFNKVFFLHEYSVIGLSLKKKKKKALIQVTLFLAFKNV